MFVEHLPSGIYGPSEYLILKVLDEEEGFLEYYRSSFGEWWNLNELHSNVAGGGKNLVKAFVDKIGKGQKVQVPVIEKETVKRLIDLGIYVDFIRRSCENIDLVADSTICDSLKMVRVLRSGGLLVTKVLLTKLNDDEGDVLFGGYPIALTIWAETPKN